MPWYARKSINLGGGARMTFSKSGVSYSFGGRGYRATTGARGTYVTLGTGGVYYRQRVAGPYGAPSRRSGAVSQSPGPVSTGGQSITTASVDQLIETSSAAIIEEINRTVQSPR